MHGLFITLSKQFRIHTVLLGALPTDRNPLFSIYSRFFFKENKIKGQEHQEMGN